MDSNTVGSLTIFLFRFYLLISEPGSYKRLQNVRFQYSSPDFTLLVNHVQTDAYAPPSKISVSIDWVCFPSMSDSNFGSFSVALMINIV
jgi:hypothetical protein